MSGFDLYLHSADMLMRKQLGFSLIELLIVVAIILIIAAIAIPSMLRARASANEAAAVSAIRTITTAQISYRISYPEIGYAASIDNLGPADVPSSSAAGLLAGDLATAPYQKTGYIFSSSGSLNSFNATATPIDPGKTGNRNFCTDTPAVIYFTPWEAACTPAAGTIL